MFIARLRESGDRRGQPRIHSFEIFSVRSYVIVYDEINSAAPCNRTKFLLKQPVLRVAADAFLPPTVLQSTSHPSKGLSVTLQGFQEGCLTFRVE